VSALQLAEDRGCKIHLAHTYGMDPNAAGVCAALRNALRNTAEELF